MSGKQGARFLLHSRPILVKVDSYQFVIKAIVHHVADLGERSTGWIFIANHSQTISDLHSSFLNLESNPRQKDGLFHPSDGTLNGHLDGLDSEFWNLFGERWEDLQVSDQGPKKGDGDSAIERDLTFNLRSTSLMENGERDRLNKKKMRAEFVWNLPKEISFLVLRWLDPIELFLLRRVCKNWKLLIHEIFDRVCSRGIHLSLEYHNDMRKQKSGKILSFISNNKWMDSVTCIEITQRSTPTMVNTLSLKIIVESEIPRFTRIRDLSIDCPLSGTTSLEFINCVTKLEKLNLNLCYLTNHKTKTNSPHLTDLSVSVSFMILPFCDFSTMTSITRLSLAWKDDTEFPLANLPLKNLKKLSIDCPPCVGEQMVNALKGLPKTIETQIRCEYKS